MDTANWMEGMDSTKEAKNTTIINFYDREVLNPKKSKEAGRPIYETRVFIHKVTPGDRLIDLHRPIRPEDKQAYPNQYQNYLNKQKDKIEGTPLEEWPYLNKTRVAELHALNILSVEHVANLPDSVAHKIMDLNDLRKRAIAYLKTAEDSAFSVKLQEKIDEKNEQIETQAKLIADLNRRLQALETPTERPPAVKKRGRPKGSKNRGTNTPRAG